MGFVSNEYIAASGVCHYCWDEKKSRYPNPILWAIHILLEHPNTMQAIRLRERATRK